MSCTVGRRRPSLLRSSAKSEAACKIAVYLHGLSGDLAEADEGEVAMTAGDVVRHLSDAVLELTARRKVVERHGSA